MFREDVVENGSESDAMLECTGAERKQYKGAEDSGVKELEIQAAIWRKSGWEFQINSAGAGKELKKNESPSGGSTGIWNGFINMKIQFMLM